MPDHTLPNPCPDLLKDATRLQEALGRLLPVVRFRDRDRACSHGLSASQGHALQALVRHGPMTVNGLAAHLFLEKSTASRLANSLLEKDMVRKRSPGSDGRVVILQVTEAGHRTSRRILNDLLEEYAELTAGFTPEVRAALPEVLERLAGSLAAREKRGLDGIPSPRQGRPRLAPLPQKRRR